MTLHVKSNTEKVNCNSNNLVILVCINDYNYLCYASINFCFPFPQHVIFIGRT